MKLHNSLIHVKQNSLLKDNKAIVLITDLSKPQ